VGQIFSTDIAPKITKNNADYIRNNDVRIARTQFMSKVYMQNFIEQTDMKNK